MEYKAWWRVPRYKKKGHLRKRPKVLRDLDRDKMIPMDHPELLGMSWREAREFVLPSGITLGVAWGRLIKANHSYYLAKKFGYQDLLNNAASMIHTLREDMSVVDTIHPRMEEEPVDDQVFV